MKAIVHRDFGSPDVLRLDEVEKPVPHADQVLVRVRAASVNPLDWHFTEGTPYLGRPLAFGLLKPEATRLGVDYAGTVESVGENVTRLKPGDDVFGGASGSLAEYVCVLSDRAVVLKPANITFDEAASVPVAAITALQALRDHGRIQPGQKVLINGASGGVGTFAVQIAKSFGADVTGVCSTKNLDLVRSLGADRVIDYTEEDFTRSEQRYDLVLDNVANRSLSECRRILKPKGIYVLVGGGGPNESRWVGPLFRVLKTFLLSPFVSQDMGMMLADMNEKDLIVLRDLLEAGKIKPVIDRRYALSEAPEALRYLEQGHARGKVVITLEPDTGVMPVRDRATAGRVSTPGAPLIALALFAFVLGVPAVPIVFALFLNGRFQRRNPAKRPFRWGYYFGIESFLAGTGLGLALESGPPAVIVCGAVYAALAWLFVRRHHGAWIALTVLSFNPIVWIINFIYLRKRWAEDSGATPALAFGA